MSLVPKKPTTPVMNRRQRRAWAAHQKRERLRIWRRHIKTAELEQKEKGE